MRTPMRRAWQHGGYRFLKPATAVAICALVLVASGSAARISGTDRGDTLRGTAKADTIYGKKGNDTLLGLAGDDLLVPGPGADVVRCGRGHDIVRADAADTVAKDCEVVKRVGPPALVGRYAGRSSQNEKVTFDVPAGGATLTRFRINSVNQSCQPPNLVATFGPLDYGTAVFPIYAAGTFTATYAGPGTVSGNPAQFDIRTSGRFVGVTASGTARFDMTFTDAAGTAFSCSSGDVGWTASFR